MADTDVERSAHHPLVELATAGTVRSAHSSPTDVADTCAETYPAGGLRAWLTVLGAFLALFCSFGHLNSFGAYQAWYADHQLHTESPSTISWIGALQLAVFLLSGTPIGRVYDAYGPRVLMVTGAVTLTASIMLTSICTRYYEFMLAQGLVFGLGAALMWYPPLSAVGTHFTRYATSALGIAATGSGFGGVVYPIMFERLFAQVGFGWTVRISAFLTLALAGAAAILVSRHPPPGRKPTSAFSIRVFLDTPFLLLTAGSALVSLGMYIPLFYIVEYAEAQHVAPRAAFYVLSIMNGGGVAGRLVLPVLADRLGQFNVFVPCVLLSGLSVLIVWPLAHSPGLIVSFAAVYGFFNGAFAVLSVPCIRRLSSPHDIGVRIGALYSALAFPAMGGNPAAGAVLQRDRGAYTGLMVFSGATIVAGALFILGARLTISPRLFERV